MIYKLSTFAALLGLAACHVQVASDPAQGEQPGRYVIAPAGHDDPQTVAHPNFYAWIVDSKTGSLKFCTYTMDAWTLGANVPAIKCESP